MRNVTLKQEKNMTLLVLSILAFVGNPIDTQHYIAHESCVNDPYDKNNDTGWI